MKKNTLWVGILYIAIGFIFLLCGLLLDTNLNSFFWGFAGGGIVPGLTMIYKYFYLTHPNNSTTYAKKLEESNINLNDERKEKFRNQSGRYTYILGLLVSCISFLIFSILYKLNIIQDSKILILYLGLYPLFQYIAGILIFQYLIKKY